jgi:hypothetical protein
MSHRQALGVLLAGSLLLLVPAAARAQGAYSDVSTPYRMNGYLFAPGYYGMAYGSPGLGTIRTYTTFTSPYGGGYGYGYAPYGLLPGRYGVGLWRPGFVTPGYAYGASYYSTFPVPYVSTSVGPMPPVGLYAPGFGPPSPLSYTMPR